MPHKQLVQVQKSIERNDGLWEEIEEVIDRALSKTINEIPKRTPREIPIYRARLRKRGSDEILKEIQCKDETEARQVKNQLVKWQNPFKVYSDMWERIDDLTWAKNIRDNYYRVIHAHEGRPFPMCIFDFNFADYSDEELTMIVFDDEYFDIDDLRAKHGASWSYEVLKRAAIVRDNVIEQKYFDTREKLFQYLAQEFEITD